MASRNLHLVKPFVVAALAGSKLGMCGLGDSNITNGDAGGHGYQVGFQHGGHGALGYTYVAGNIFGADGSGDDAVVDAILSVSVVAGWELSGTLTTLGDISDFAAAGDSNGPAVGLEDGTSAPAGFINPTMVRSSLQDDWPTWFVPDTWNLAFNYGWVSFGSAGDGALETALRWGGNAYADGTSPSVNSHATERDDAGASVLNFAQLEAGTGNIVAGTGTSNPNDRIIFTARPNSKGPTLHNFVVLENLSATEGLQVATMHGVGGDTTTDILADLNANSDEYWNNFMATLLLPQSGQAMKKILFYVVAGGNDWASAVPEATVESNLQAIITKLRSIASNAGLSPAEYQILLVGYHPRTSSTNFGYRTLLDSLAQSNGIGYFDPTDHYSLGDMTSWWDGGSDNAHLTDAGYVDFSTTILSAAAAAENEASGGATPGGGGTLAPKMDKADKTYR